MRREKPPVFESLRDLRVVIVGASSGIGRAAALAFAREGARLVIAARRGEVLAEVARECQAAGGKALAVVTDAADAGAVQALAQQADVTMGGIDVWINNAGTGVFGPFQDADIALHRRTIEVNLIGAMNGAWAVLPILRRQGRGILINTVSLGGWTPAPYAAAYTASKFGLRGFAASLRQELADQPDIHICGVFPAMVDTPGFAHGANVSGRSLDPGPLLYTSEDVAKAFLKLAQHPRDEVAVGWPARAGQLSYILARKPLERLSGRAVDKLLARAKPAARTEGALLAPLPEGQGTSGGWLAQKKLPSAGPLSLGLVGAGLAGLFLLAGVGRRRDRLRG